MTSFGECDTERYPRSFGIRQRKRESHALHADELRAGDAMFAPGVAGFRQDLFQSAHLLGFFQKQEAVTIRRMPLRLRQSPSAASELKPRDQLPLARRDERRACRDVPEPGCGLSGGGVS